MVDLVVDSSVWVAAFLEEDDNHEHANHFMGEFRSGVHRCHLPVLVMVETCPAIGRRRQKDLAFVMRVRLSFDAWTQRGLVTWYNFDFLRMSITINFNLSFPNPLRGSDSIGASLSDELGYTLKTFDHEILDRYFRATI